MHIKYTVDAVTGGHPSYMACHSILEEFLSMCYALSVVLSFVCLCVRREST